MDPTSRKIICYMNKSPKGAEYSIALSPLATSYMDASILDLSKSIQVPLENTRTAVRYLEKTGYIEYIYSNGKKVGFSLSHMGVNWKYFRRQNFLKYLADKWVDVLALVLSICSFALSLTALLQ